MVALSLWITKRLMSEARTKLAIFINRQDGVNGQKWTRTGISGPEQAIDCLADNHQGRLRSYSCK